MAGEWGEEEKKSAQLRNATELTGKYFYERMSLIGGGSVEEVIRGADEPS